MMYQKVKLPYRNEQPKLRTITAVVRVKHHPNDRLHGFMVRDEAGTLLLVQHVPDHVRAVMRQTRVAYFWGKLEPTAEEWTIGERVKDQHW